MEEDLARSPGASRLKAARTLTLDLDQVTNADFIRSFQPTSQGCYRGCGLDQWLALVSDAKFVGFARVAIRGDSPQSPAKCGRASVCLKFRPCTLKLCRRYHILPPLPTAQ